MKGGLSAKILGMKSNTKVSSHNLNLSIHFSVVSCVSLAQRKSKQLYGKIQIVTRCSCMWIHVKYREKRQDESEAFERLRNKKMTR